MDVASARLVARTWKYEFRLSGERDGLANECDGSSSQWNDMFAAILGSAMGQLALDDPVAGQGPQTRVEIEFAATHAGDFRPPLAGQQHEPQQDLHR